MASTGLWWILFAIPLMLNVKEKSTKIQMNTDDEHQVKSPIKGLIHAFVTIRSVPYLGVFLMAFFMYNDAVQTTISQATNLANELLGMGMTEVLTAGMMIQFVAIFGSLLFLFLEKKIGTKKAVFIALINWCFILVWASIMQNKTEFYILCAWVGLVLGVTQSGSRTLFAQQIPQEHSAQLFSFYTVADRASAVVGPVLFAIGTMILPIRYSILPMLIMLIIGTIWLKKIPMKTEIN
jgi:UMF1 family MFS transporter